MRISPVTAEVRGPARGIGATGRPAPMIPSGLVLPGIEASGATWVDRDVIASIAPGELVFTGAAVTILAASYRQRPTGSLPEDDSALLALLRPEDRTEIAWDRLKELLFRQWTPCSDGRLYRHQIAVFVLTTWLEVALVPSAVDPATGLGLLAEAVACLRRLKPRAEILDRVAAATGQPPRPDIDDRPPDEYDASSAVAAQELFWNVREASL